jgi:hypothetical protein
MLGGSTSLVDWWREIGFPLAIRPKFQNLDREWETLLSPSIWNPCKQNGFVSTFLTVNMSPRKAVVLRLIVYFLLAVSQCSLAFPCTCSGPNQAKTMRDVAEWYTKESGVALIFKGTVVKQELHTGSVGGPPNAMSMTRSGTYRVINFDVTTIYRGDKQEHISVITGLGTGDCGYPFESRHEYLVYAIKASEGIWFTSICSGTAAIEDAGTAIRFLTRKKPTDEDLLSPQEYQKRYYEKILPTRTGSVCGQVMKPDGSPLKGASVEVWELRDDDLPHHGAADENTSNERGHFCIDYVVPGRYILTAESYDFDRHFRYMAFYPGVYSEPQAAPLEMKAGVKLPDISVKTIQERLYTIRIRVIAPDGTHFSYENGCGVKVDSIYKNPLSYHIDHALETDGTYTFGLIPPGKYVVATYFEPDFSGSQPKPFPDASKWKTASKEVVVTGDTEVLIQMERTTSQ